MHFSRLIHMAKWSLSFPQGKYLDAKLLFIILSCAVAYRVWFRDKYCHECQSVYSTVNYCDVLLQELLMWSCWQSLVNNALHFDFLEFFSSRKMLFYDPVCREQTVPSTITQMLRTLRLLNWRCNERPRKFSCFFIVCIALTQIITTWSCEALSLKLAQKNNHCTYPKITIGCKFSNEIPN